MLSTAMQEALNEQIRYEFYSSYLYLAMSAYFEGLNLPGCAHWMRVQSEEEWGHALRLFDYVNERGGQVVLKAIEQPPAEFESPLDAFQKALEHERKVTQTIHRLYAQAVEENDYPTQVHLHWFVEEQVEEEKSLSEIVAQLEMVKGHPPALLMLDAKLGERSE